VNVPLCLAGLVMAWRGLPSGPPARGGQRLDLTGLLLLPPALIALLYGLAEVSGDGGFGHPGVIIPLTAGAALLAAYAAHALTTSRAPLVDLRLLRVRSFSAATSLLFLAGLSIYGGMLLLPLYYQSARGESALAAGLLLIPQGAGSLLPRTLAGRLTDKLGARPVVLAGIVLAAAGTVPFALAGPHPDGALLGAALVVRGAGLGTATIAVMAGAFTGLDRGQVPSASSVTRIVQFLGGSFGAAVLVAVILGGQVAGHAGATAGATARATAGAANAAGPAGLAAAFGTTFWWCVGFTALAVVPALLLSSGTRMTVTSAQSSRDPEPAARPAR
jgi:MFS transporter